MAGKNRGGDAPQLSPAEIAQIQRAARQSIAYAEFFRWGKTYERGEITRRTNEIFKFSPLVTSMFAFGVEGTTLYLGVQKTEKQWVEPMPFDRAYVSDRLYLCCDSMDFDGITYPTLILGFYVSDTYKLEKMAECKIIEPKDMVVENGEVIEVGRSFGDRIPLLPGNVMQEQLKRERERMAERQDF
jgi:hypothetical protein